MVNTNIPWIYWFLLDFFVLIMIDCVIYQHEYYVTAFKSEIVLLQDKFVVVPSAVEMRLFKSADKHVNRSFMKIVSQILQNSYFCACSLFVPGSNKKMDL